MSDWRARLAVAAAAASKSQAAKAAQNAAENPTNVDKQLSADKSKQVAAKADAQARIIVGSSKAADEAKKQEDEAEAKAKDAANAQAKADADAKRVATEPQPLGFTNSLRSAAAAVKRTISNTTQRASRSVQGDTKQFQNYVGSMIKRIPLNQTSEDKLRGAIQTVHTISENPSIKNTNNPTQKALLLESLSNLTYLVEKTGVPRSEINLATGARKGGYTRARTVKRNKNKNRNK